ncbi:MAG: ExeM/NucH family extracellular endonuclease, partial [Gammaproteobacteria bacterium]
MTLFPPARTPLLAPVLASLLAALAAPAGATSTLVISQVYGGGGNSGSVFSNDFIELFNRGDTPIDLTGKSVQYASSSGATWAVTPLPQRVLQPGQYLLVQEASGADTTRPLPTPDASGTLTLASGSGKVALSSGTTPLSGANPASGVLDLLGYGSANAAEGMAAPQLSNSTAARRADACVDTDQNSADFIAATPTPRSSSSPATPCGAPAAAPIVPACPDTLGVRQGAAGAVLLSAQDADSIVNGAAITAGAVPGVSLGPVTSASAMGATASVELRAGPSLAPGAWPVVVTFTNDAGQSASCAVTVAVAGVQTIPQLQGSGATSPFAGTVQTTQGVVTHLLASGYFLQDETGDGNPATSDAIFVYTGAAPTLRVGDLVRVTGTVTEYKPAGAARSYTEIKDVSVSEVLGSGRTIAPVNVAFAATGGKLDHLEAMLVSFTDALTVNGTDALGERGELALSSGRRETPTNRYRPGTPDALALAAANLDNRITLDDSLFVAPAVVPYLGADGTVRAGDTVSGLTGAIDYGALGGGGAGFKLQPTVAPVFSRTNARAAPPQLAAGNVRVASANVLNFFTTFTDGTDAWGRTGQGCRLGASTSKSNCRGADNLAEFIRQRDKIVGELKVIDADVVGLMEIQNNGDIAVDYLVQALNAAIGHDAYAVVPQPAATGTDAIRVAMIYKPATL